MTHAIRPAGPGDIPALARIWHDGWHQAHAAHVPATLTRLRTAPDFARRLAAFGDDLRVCGPPGLPLGLCAVKGDTLDQLYVAPAARGTGLAAALVAEAEARLAARGVAIAQLDCVPENHVAARFYGRQGWQQGDRRRCMLETSRGPFPLEVLRFIKYVAPA